LWGDGLAPAIISHEGADFTHKTAVRVNLFAIRDEPRRRFWRSAFVSMISPMMRIAISAAAFDASPQLCRSTALAGIMVQTPQAI
jgi:hypothetical protein